MSHDDILNARIQKNLLRQNTNPLPRYDLNRKTLEEILDMIILYSNVGVSNMQLVESIGKDRKTIRRYLNLLEKMSLVIRDGKRGKYFPKTKRHRDASISADILTESFRNRVLDLLNEPFVLDSPHFKEKVPYKEFEPGDAIFNFSNIIGGWITYLLIQSMSHANLPVDRKDNIENKLSVAAFIEDAISLIQPYLLPFFNNYVSSCLKTLRKRIDDMEGGFNMHNVLQVNIDLLFKGGLFDEESILELNNAFSKIYPNLSHELEKTRLELPILIRRKIDERKCFEELIRRQENCKLHEYVPLPYDSDEDYSIFRCNKCGKTRKKEK